MQCSLTLNKPASAREHYGPGEVKLDLTFRPIARDLQGLNRKISVHEGCCLYDVSPRNQSQSHETDLLTIVQIIQKILHHMFCGQFASVLRH
jgi:hypothetical protein